MRRAVAPYGLAALLLGTLPAAATPGLPEEIHKSNYDTYAICRDFGLAPEKRIAACKALLANTLQDKQMAAVLFFLASAYDEQQDYPHALEALELAHRALPGAWQPLFSRAAVHHDMRDFAAALADIDAAQAMAPDEPVLHRARARELLALSRPAEALAAIGKALDKLQDSFGSLVLRSEIHLRLHQYDEAMADAEAAISAAADKPDGYNQRCWVRAVTGREFDQALADCQHALALREDSAILDSRGLVHFKLGQFQDALTDYEAALAKGSRSPNTKYMRGVTKLRLGDTTGGQADIDAALKVDPDTAAKMSDYGVSAP